MKISKTDLSREVDLARSRGWSAICAQAEQRHRLPAGLLLAIASRETNMQDICGDAGHGRGLFQIDDRSHVDFLKRCGAYGAGGMPPLAEAAEYAASLLDANRAFGRSKGIAGDALVKFMISAYNAGAGNALAGYQHGDSDARTAGGDYASDVLERLAAIGGNGGAGDGAAGILRKGARGRAVTQLKQDLQAWFDREAPGTWQTFGVAPGPAFGPALDKAVRDFQQRNGLTVDGEVGDQTRGVLANAAPTPPPAPPPVPASGGILRKGARGAAVTQLKKDLQAWFDREAPGTWQTFGVAPGPAFGPALEKAVRAFQEGNGLTVDGEVGDQTRGAL
jgi:peptidoglycan hydrolase-like protein with peptidoglycan-binding domain